MNTTVQYLQPYRYSTPALIQIAFQFAYSNTVRGLYTTVTYCVLVEPKQRWQQRK